MQEDIGKWWDIIDESVKLTCWSQTHCFSLQISLPCAEMAWTSANPFDWAQSMRERRPLPPIRSSLRDLAGRGVINAVLDDQALFILLHALMSISWALLFRDLSDFSMVHESKILQWKDNLRKAFETWRERASALFEERRQVARSPVDMPIYWVGIPFAYMGG